MQNLIFDNSSPDFKVYAEKVVDEILSLLPTIGKQNLSGLDFLPPSVGAALFLEHLSRTLLWIEVKPYPLHTYPFPFGSMAQALVPDIKNYANQIIRETTGKDSFFDFYDEKIIDLDYFYQLTNYFHWLLIKPSLEHVLATLPDPVLPMKRMIELDVSFAKDKIGNMGIVGYSTSRGSLFSCVESRKLPVLSDLSDKTLLNIHHLYPTIKEFRANYIQSIRQQLADL